MWLISFMSLVSFRHTLTPTVGELFSRAHARTLSKALSRTLARADSGSMACLSSFISMACLSVLDDDIWVIIPEMYEVQKGVQE